MARQYTEDQWREFAHQGRVHSQQKGDIELRGDIELPDRTLSKDERARTAGKRAPAQKALTMPKAMNGGRR